MPRNLPHFTKCAAPGDSFSMDGGSIALRVVGGLLIGAVAGTAFHGVLVLLGHAAGFGCAIGVGIGAFITFGIVEFKDWYYNFRLMCIKKDVCAAGTIVGEPRDSTDGDRKLDILIAPFDVPETEQLIIELLTEMGAAGELADVPDAVDLQNRQVRFGFLRGLDGQTLRKFYVRLTEEKMFNQADRDFLKHFYRRDADAMGQAAFDHSPDDTGDDPNPMFRLTHAEGDDPEEDVLVPWMHCEVEGNRLERWLDNVLAGWLTGFIAWAALCIACTVVSLGTLDFLCGAAGAVAAAVLAFLVWLISHFVNNPDDGVASGVDVDVEDAGFDTPPTSAQHGDVVYMFGNWVMDEEHDNYFEIHPVKAYYLLCGEPGSDDWQPTEERPAADCNFDVKKITGEDMARMCKVVKSVENTDPDEQFTIDIKHALSMKP